MTPIKQKRWVHKPRMMTDIYYFEAEVLPERNGNMEKNTINDIMDTSMARIRDMVDVNTVVGDPIQTPDGITIIPVSKVTFGFGSGGSEYPIKEKSGIGGGGAAAVKLEPIGFLIVKDGNVRMLNVSQPAGTTVDRLVEMIPDVIERVQGFIEKNKGKIAETN